MRRFTTLLGAGAALATLLPAGAAAAHMPYLLPARFILDAKASFVSLAAAFTEKPFQPEVVMRSDFFAIRDAKGVEKTFTPTYLRELAVAEAPIDGDGTYRLSSGQRLGRNSKMFKGPKGDWLMLGEESDEKPPASGLVDAQSVTVAEAYVTRGAPTTAALQPKGVGLELKPLTHPSDIAAKEQARFQLLFHGKPLAGQVVRLYRAHGAYDGRLVPAEAPTAADGSFAFTAPDAGLYMTIVRYRTQAPAGAATPYRSYTHTLSFEAAE